MSRRRRRQLRAGSGDRRGQLRPKGLRITLRPEHSKPVLGRGKLRSVGKASWHVYKAPPVLREPRPAKLPGGRRAGKIEGAFQGRSTATIRQHTEQTMEPCFGIGLPGIIWRS